MRNLGYSLAGALIGLTVVVASAQAQYQPVLGANYYGPRQVGNMCFNSNHHGTAFGYWAPCKSEGSATTARAQARRHR